MKNKSLLNQSLLNLGAVCSWIDRNWGGGYKIEEYRYFIISVAGGKIAMDGPEDAVIKRMMNIPWSPRLEISFWWTTWYGGGM